MMNNINKFNEIVEYIETHLDSQLDINLLSKKQDCLYMSFGVFFPLLQVFR